MKFALSRVQPLLLLLVLLLSGPLAALGQPEAPPPPRDGMSLSDAALPAQPVTLPRCQQFDFTSRTNGEKYRLMVSTPAAAPGTRFPVVYLLDGYWYFHAAARAVPAQFGDHLNPAILVGIGYPTEDMALLLQRRAVDLSPPRRNPNGTDAESGQSDFIRMLLEEVRPFVESRYPVDVRQQTLFGVSLGGATVLRVMFTHPESFQTFVAASPAIYVNDNSVLADEKSFFRRAASGMLSLRLLVTASGDEQYRGADPVLLAADPRFVDNALELADRLSPLARHGVAVQRVVFPGETHKSGSLAALARGLRFALARDAAPLR